MRDFAPTERTQVRRLPKRAVYDREAIYRILDEGLVCHVGFVVDGQPVLIPTGYGRDGDTLYVHGSAASRMLRDLAKGVEVSIAVTLLDGLGSGSFGVSPLDELPLGGDFRYRRRRRGSDHKA